MAHEPELVLHIWPGLWSLPNFTPTCLASVLYLQLAMPGQFIVEETSNSDLSPDGQLPYLTHGLACIASFPSIVKYADGLKRRRETNEDDENGEDGAAHSLVTLSPEKRAQQTAWMAYVSANLGDLVACHFFTLRHNYFEYVRPALANIFPVPQRYYVPDRLREMYKPRLEAAGLWTVHAEEAEEEKRQKKGIASHIEVHEAFGKEKVLEKARTCFDLLSRLLGNKPFFLDSPEPTALDVLVAAHILVLNLPHLPNKLVATLVNESYPSVLAHAQRVKTLTYAPQDSEHSPSASMSSSFDVVDAQSHHEREHIPLRVRTASPPTFSQVLSSLTLPLPWGKGFWSSGKREKSKEEKEFDRMRWAWFGLAALGIAGWVWSVGREIVVNKVEPSDDEDEGKVGAPEEEVEDEDFEEGEEEEEESEEEEEDE